MDGRRGSKGDWWAVATTAVVLAGIAAGTRLASDRPAHSGEEVAPGVVPARRGGEPLASAGVDGIQATEPMGLVPRNEIERLVDAALRAPTGLTRDSYQFIRSSAGYFHSMPSYVGPGFDGSSSGTTAELELVALGPEALPALLRFAREDPGRVETPLRETEWVEVSRPLPLEAISLRTTNLMDLADGGAPHLGLRYRPTRAERALEIVGHIVNRPYLTHRAAKFAGMEVFRWRDDGSPDGLDLRARLLEDLGNGTIDSAYRLGSAVRLRRYYPEELECFDGLGSGSLGRFLRQVCGGTADAMLWSRLHPEPPSVLDLVQLARGLNPWNVAVDPEEFARIQRGPVCGYPSKDAFPRWRRVDHDCRSAGLTTGPWRDVPRPDWSSDELALVMWLSRDDPWPADTIASLARDERRLTWLPDTLADAEGVDFEGETVAEFLRFVR